MSEKLGKDRLQKVVILLVLFFNQAKAVAPGGVQPIEVFQFIDELSQIPETFKNPAEIKAQLDDLDPAETEEIIAEVMKTINVSAEKAKRVVAKALRAASADYDLVTELLEKDEAGTV